MTPALAETSPRTWLQLGLALWPSTLGEILQERINSFPSGPRPLSNAPISAEGAVVITKLARHGNSLYHIGSAVICKCTAPGEAQRSTGRSTW